MTSPSEPPSTAEPDRDETSLLLAFVHERDVHCPKCNYNLRNLTLAVCPECREELRLHVGMRKVRFGPLIASLTPGIFSGMCAFFLGVMLFFFIPMSPTGKAPWFLYAAEFFGLASGAFMIALLIRRSRFLRMPAERQWAFAIIIWITHIAFTILLWLFAR